MQESYTGSHRIKRLSPQQIRKMKENMRKVPLIQAKSDQYHQSEAEHAEHLLNTIEQETPIVSQLIKSEKTEKLSRFQKIKKYLF